MKPMRWNTLQEAADYLAAQTNEKWTPRRIIDVGEKGMVNVQAVLPDGTRTFTKDDKTYFNGNTVSLEGVYLDHLLKHDSVVVSATTNRWLNVSVNLEPPATFTYKELGITGRDLEAFASTLVTKPPATASVEAVRGITKGEVINAFEGIHFDRDKWNRALANLNDHPWLKYCWVTPPGKKGSRVPRTWNPVLIASALYGENGKGITIKKLDAVFVGLKHWADKWREASEGFRPKL